MLRCVLSIRSPCLISTSFHPGTLTCAEQCEEICTLNVILAVGQIIGEPQGAGPASALGLLLEAWEERSLVVPRAQPESKV
jgi:hypothetical protein